MLEKVVELFHVWKHFAIGFVFVVLVITKIHHVLVNLLDVCHNRFQLDLTLLNRKLRHVIDFLETMVDFVYFLLYFSRS